MGLKGASAVVSTKVSYAAVVSAGRSNTGLKFLCWCLILQGHSRALVELAGDCTRFGLAKARYIIAFWEVLSE